jgi:hypothetical protein
MHVAEDDVYDKFTRKLMGVEGTVEFPRFHHSQVNKTVKHGEMNILLLEGMCLVQT